MKSWRLTTHRGSVPAEEIFDDLTVAAARSREAYPYQTAATVEPLEVSDDGETWSTAAKGTSQEELEGGSP